VSFTNPQFAEAVEVRNLNGRCRKADALGAATVALEPIGCLPVSGLQYDLNISSS
jgi:hypothetical protein